MTRQTQSLRSFLPTSSVTYLLQWQKLPVRCVSENKRIMDFTLTCFTQLDALRARTGFETILFGVRSSADHYTTPFVHASSPAIPKFFDVVINKPVADLATAIEAFCLSGVNGESTQCCLSNMSTYENRLGVIGKLAKEESQLRGEVATLITEKLRRFPGASRICQDTDQPPRAYHKRVR